MSIVQALVAFAFLLLGARALFRSQGWRTWLFIGLGLIAANTVVRAADRPQLSLDVVTDHAIDPTRVDALLADVAQAYRADLNIDIVIVGHEENDALPTDESPTFLIPKLVPLDHHGAHTLLLLTSRQLHAGTLIYAGSATIGSPCDDSAVAVVTLSAVDAVTAQVIKHELAHTIGVGHDGEGVCASETSNSFIMAPATTAYKAGFSQCSKDTVALLLQSSAQCMAPKSSSTIVPPAALPPAEKDFGGGAFAVWFLWIVTLLTLARVYPLPQSNFGEKK